jgi:hypothetical protein
MRLEGWPRTTAAPGRHPSRRPASLRSAGLLRMRSKVETIGFKGSIRWFGDSEVRITSVPSDDQRHSSFPGARGTRSAAQANPESIAAAGSTDPGNDKRSITTRKIRLMKSLHEARCQYQSAERLTHGLIAGRLSPAPSGMTHQSISVAKNLTKLMGCPSQSPGMTGEK